MISYKRVEQFERTLEQFQCKTTILPDPIYQIILNNITEDKRNDITPYQLHQLLKKQKLDQYLDCIPAIISKLTNKDVTPLFNETQKTVIMNKFHNVNNSFNLLINKNFFPYVYVLYKILELLDYNDYLKFIIFNSNLWANKWDANWKKICEHNGWKFNPTN